MAGKMDESRSIEEPTRNKKPLPLLEYGVAQPSQSARTWAWTFLLSGGYALACIPAVFLFEHIGWEDAPLHITSFLACIICAVSAAMYLNASRASMDGATRAVKTMRMIAYLALALTAGFLLLCAALIVLLAASMDDF